LSRLGDRDEPRRSDPSLVELPRAEPDAIRPILIGLSGEIRRPLERLRQGIDRLLGDETRPTSDAEIAHARAMLGLCDELDRLTRDCLERTPPPGEA
jgi:hypothetical protein